MPKPRDPEAKHRAADGDAHGPDSAPRRPRKVEAAFDLWLQRGLHDLYNDVAREPIPDELLRLIDEDRKK